MKYFKIKKRSYISLEGPWIARRNGCEKCKKSVRELINGTRKRDVKIFRSSKYHLFLGHTTILKDNPRPF
jgi:hypothetical protein